jgi:hypothetical protein
MYTTLKIISRKFLGVSLIWTFFSHVGAIFYETAHMMFSQNMLSSIVQIPMDYGILEAGYILFTLEYF